MAYSLEGDPRMLLDADGSRLNYIDGQPTMDQGLENLALICLFTSPGWVGNILFPNSARRYGSDFEETARGTITLDRLNRIENAAIRALSRPVFGEVIVQASNPVGNRLEVKILIKPPGADLRVLLLEKSGTNWQAQFLTPASERI